MTDPEASGVVEDVSASPRRSLARNAGALLGAQAITWTMSFAMAVVLPRYVGPEAIGEYRIATALWAVAVIAAALGTATLITLDTARTSGSGVVVLGPTLVARSVAMLLATGVVVVFVGLFGYGRETLVLVLVLAVSNLFASYGEVARSALTGLENMAPIASADIASKFVLAVAVIAIAITTRNIQLVAVAGIGGSLVYAVALMRSLRGSARIDLSASFESVWTTVKRARPYLAIGLTLVVYHQIDTVVMSFFVDEREIGWYGTADTLYGTLLFVPTILMTSLLPVLTRAHTDDPARAASLLTRSCRSVLLLAIPIGLGTTLVAGPVAETLYGSEYDGTGEVLAVYGVVLLVSFLTILLGQYSLAVGAQRFWNILMVVGVVLTIPLDVVLVQWTHRQFDNGAIGGALTYVVTEGVMLVAGIWKFAPGLVGRSGGVRLLKGALAGAAMVAAVWPLRDRFVLIPIAAGVVVYPVALFLLRPFDAEERAAIAGARAKVRGRLRR
jgi:O-antigen/teichoic acid export membrane protein